MTCNAKTRGGGDDTPCKHRRILLRAKAASLVRAGRSLAVAEHLLSYGLGFLASSDARSAAFTASRSSVAASAFMAAVSASSFKRSAWRDSSSDFLRAASAACFAFCKFFLDFPLIPLEECHALLGFDGQQLELVLGVGVHGSGGFLVHGLGKGQLLAHLDAVLAAQALACFARWYSSSNLVACDFNW